MAWMDMGATCSILVVDVDNLACIQVLVYGVHILALGLAWLDSHIRPPLPVESGNSGLRSALALVGCSASSLSEMGFAVDC